MERELTITKVAPLKGALNLSYKEKFFEEESADEINEVSMKCSRLYHPDFANAFCELIPHLVLITEQEHDIEVINLITSWIDKGIESIDKDDKIFNDILNMYKPSMVVFKGSGEKESVSIQGEKMLKKMHEFMGITTPAIKWTYGYTYMNELKIVCDDIRHEAIEYLNGKKAPDAQLSLMDELDGTGVTTSDEKPAKSKRKQAAKEF